MKKILIILLLVQINTLFASDFEEVNLNTATHERTQFLNYPSVIKEFNKIYALGDGEQEFKLNYFASYRNILPPGIPASKFIANEHVAIFKSELSDTYCSVRVNIVWRNEQGLNILDEDYSEPAQFYKCYEL